MSDGETRSIPVSLGVRYIMRYEPTLRPYSGSFETTSVAEMYGPPSLTCMRGIGIDVRSARSPSQTTSWHAPSLTSRASIGFLMPLSKRGAMSRSEQPIARARRLRVETRAPGTRQSGEPATDSNTVAYQAL